MVDVRRYKILEDAPARWIVRVRWCEHWTDEPDSTSIIEPTIAQPATIPQNRHLSFIQIVSNPFPYYPPYSEIYYQPEDESEVGGSEGSINTWQPGFVVEENEYQYKVLYMNKDWKPHPLLAMDEGEEVEDDAKRAEKNQAERLRIKAEYKYELIRQKLSRDRKRRAKLHKDRRAAVDAARAVLVAAEARAAGEQPPPRSPQQPPQDDDDDDEKLNESIDVETAQRRLDLALAALDAPEDELLEEEQDDEDEEDEDGNVRQISVTRPSISKQPDTSLIYHIDYPQLDPTFIYDPDLARLDHDRDGGGVGGGMFDDDGNPLEDLQGDEAELEAEMTRPDPYAPQHPSKWLDQNGEEKQQQHQQQHMQQITETKRKKKNKKVKTKTKKGERSKSENGFSGGDGFYDSAGEESSDDDDEDDNDDGDVSDSDEDPSKLRPPPLLTTDGGEPYVVGRRPFGNNDEIPQLTQLDLNQWYVDHPRYIEAWVNKYSTRLKRSTTFFNMLYDKYLHGLYESLEDKFFREQRKMEALIEAERSKPKRWYQLTKRDVESETLKMMERFEQQASKEEYEAMKVVREDTFEIDDTGLEKQRKECFEKIIDQEHKWILEDPLELDGDHMVETGVTISNIKHKRRIHQRDGDDIWSSFMADAWVRYRYEYRDPNHPDFVMNNGGGSSSGSGGMQRQPTQKQLLRASSKLNGGDTNDDGSTTKKRQAPKRFKWIWAQIQGKDSNEMILFLSIPEHLKRFATISNNNNASSSNLVGRTPVRRGGSMTMASSVAAATALASNMSADRVVLKKEDELGNSRKIKYWHDRIRRWAMDSYRRYQIELASQGMFLIFVNRIAIEANEDTRETEKELNNIVTQFVQARDPLPLFSKQASMARLAASANALTASGGGGGASSPMVDPQAAAGGRSRFARFNKRGSIMGRTSVFQMNAASSASSSNLLRSSPAGAMEFQFSKEFSSNHFASNDGYGIIGYDDMREDGNSLYRAVSLQLFGTPDNYLFIKQQCIQHISSHASYYCGFLDINFEYYLSIKFRSLDPTQEVVAYGDHLDLQAICEMYDVAVHIYSQIELGSNGMAVGNTSSDANGGGMNGGSNLTPGSIDPFIPSTSSSSYSSTNTDSSSSSSGPTSVYGPDSLLHNQPFIRFYDEVLPEGSKLPTICLSYAGYGHYDAIKHRSTSWPLSTSLGFPVYTRTRIANVVLKARQRTEYESVEKVRVEEARRAYELIATATAHAPLGRTSAMKQAAKSRKQERRKRRLELAAARAAGHQYLKEESSESEEDVTLETIIAQMTNRHTRQVKPIDTIKMELNRTILQPRELVLSTYIGEVLFKGDVDIQTATFLDCLASCKIEYGTKKELLASGYHVQQAFSERFWHDMQMQSMDELVSQQNLEGLAAVAMFSQEDGAGGATTMTGEGLKLNLPRVIVMYPYYPEDAHLEGEELEEHQRKMRGKVNRSGLPPLMLIEGVQLAVEEMVRLVRRMAKMTKLVRTSQATWLPPC